MIRNGIYAKYNSCEYDTNSDISGNTYIYTRDKECNDDTFVDDDNSGLFEKQINKDELEEIYSIHTFGYVKEFKVNVDREFDTTYRIYTMNTEIAQPLF